MENAESSIPEYFDLEMFESVQFYVLKQEDLFGLCYFNFLSFSSLFPLVLNYFFVIRANLTLTGILG